MNGRIAIVISLMRVGSEIHQRTDAQIVAFLRGYEAWRLPTIFGCMRIDTRCGELLRNVPHHVDSPCSNCSEQQTRIVSILNNTIRLVEPGDTLRRVHLVEIYRPGGALVKTAESIH